MNYNETRPNAPAFNHNIDTGLSKREYFAGIALQGILSNAQYKLSDLTNGGVKDITETACKLADEIITTLNKAV